LSMSGKGMGRFDSNTQVDVWEHAQVNPLVRPLLAGLSILYGAAVRTQERVYTHGLIKTRHLPCPVFSVGNLTVGGAGKTPMVGMIARMLREQGRHPVVLTRGYKRRGTERITVVSDGKGMVAGPEESGDEPAMLARWVPDVPVVVGKDRYASGMMAFRRFGPDCFVLDDGFQHRRLFRDRDIVVINARDPFGGGNLLPLGRLREPVAALRRASLILVNKSLPGRSIDPIIERIRCYNGRAPVLETTYEPDTLVSAGGRGGPMPLALLRERPVFAFAGIAAPDAFFLQLEGLGARIAHRCVFSDHHWFSPSEIAHMREQAHACGAEYLVTTEKDGVRLPAEGRDGIFLLIMKMGLKERDDTRGQGPLSILVQGVFS